jgi:hypothetical protein
MWSHLTVHQSNRTASGAEVERHMSYVGVGCRFMRVCGRRYIIIDDFILLILYVMHELCSSITRDTKIEINRYMCVLVELMMGFPVIIY